MSLSAKSTVLLSVAQMGVAIAAITTSVWWAAGSLAKTADIDRLGVKMDKSAEDVHGLQVAVAVLQSRSDILLAAARETPVASAATAEAIVAAPKVKQPREVQAAAPPPATALPIAPAAQ